MYYKELRLSAKTIIKEHKKEISNIFSVLIILSSFTFFFVNPIIKSFLKEILKIFETDIKFYPMYNMTLDVTSLGISSTIALIIPDFIGISIIMNLIENNTVSLNSIKLNFSKINHYLCSKLITILIQSGWYLALNIIKLILCLVCLIIACSVFSLGLTSVFLFIIIPIAYIVFLFIINFLIYTNLFAISFIALDGEYETKPRDIYKTYRKIMKKNRFKSFKLLLNILPMFILMTLVLGFGDKLMSFSKTITITLMLVNQFLLIYFYPYILITLGLFYKRILNYAE